MLDGHDSRDARHVRWSGVLAAGATMLYPLAIYGGLQVWSPRVMALALVVLIVLRLGALSRAGLFRTPGLGLAAGAIALLVALSNEALPLKLYPAAVNVAMLAVFGWSLWHPPTVVERLARMRDPDLPPRGVAYTRRVTQAWCVFFVFNGGVAAATAFLASNRIWALYNGGIAYVLIGAMFAGEWLVRRRVMGRSAAP
ncbi:hypothetical protein CURE108131_20330 [Cupriavidus respiraculi]|uniref:DNA gyrase subunit B n=2 Tax=Cupriavidus respiraculi TaxID=195930 RepID=A0ABM8XEA6_9BURK|nr:hypothetical protein LMG21510_03566 [Cupriavidus respiraculi]